MTPDCITAAEIMALCHVSLGGMMGHADTRMVERVYARIDAAQLADLALGTVPILYRTEPHRLDSSDPSRLVIDVIPAESGSDCWTRTSDPVINSHLTSRAYTEDSALSVGRCASGVRELLGSRRAVREMSMAWDELEKAANDE